ncbi:DUF177 domain-containing protein [Flavobacteriales bacterium]|jgi:uncharacterized protein|nr:DUF177 domain-containing protein [Crocinitomicaceae bacterium]MDA7742791.1 DUF177 domain-containing protein [Flavobacteriales bacterium]
MNHLAPYRIAFVGLKPGKHDFQMEVDKLFFESFPHAETDEIFGNLSVTLDKLGSRIYCVADFEGFAKLPCDRCLEPVNVTLTFSERLIVQLGELTDTDEEIWTLGPECHELDISQPVFEWLHLNLPSRRLHEEQDECDPEVMDFLVDGSTRTSTDLHGSSGDSGKDEDSDIDPRWNALKDLK